MNRSIDDGFIMGFMKGVTSTMVYRDPETRKYAYELAAEYIIDKDSES